MNETLIVVAIDGFAETGQFLSVKHFRITHIHAPPNELAANLMRRRHASTAIRFQAAAGAPLVSKAEGRKRKPEGKNLKSEV